MENDAFEPRVMDLVYWITERYSIKMRRDAGEKPPWTADSVMATTRFCNVHREDDKVTKWIRKNWNRPDDPAWRFTLGRMINLPESLDSMRAYETPEQMKITLKNKRKDGHRIFTNVYTISTCGKQMDKLDYVFDNVITDVSMNPISYNSLEDAANSLTAVDGLGTFLAGQIIADMKNTVGHPLEKAEDWWTWCAPGPGSLRGLSEFWRHSVTPNNFQIHFDECRKLVDPLIPAYIPRISAQDMQNCLCEISKYIRVKNGGYARNRYFAKESA